MRRLQGKPPVSDLFGVKGRKWLRELELPVEEAETLEGALRHVDFPHQGIAAAQPTSEQADRQHAAAAGGDPAHPKSGRIVPVDHRPAETEATGGDLSPRQPPATDMTPKFVHKTASRALDLHRSSNAVSRVAAPA
jgi:hypothetical protein